MNCPFCPFAGSRRQVHAHLLAEHGDRVAPGAAGPGGPALRVACPSCSEELSVPFDPGARAPALRDEVERAARMVLFDMLLYHLEAAHLPGG
jgi:hypothetical protein